jgi:type II secretory pathway predicted ATPase ExeA
MELGAAGLKEQPFRTHGRPLVFVGYSGQQKAFEFLDDTYEHVAGLGLFQGPSLSGKSTILKSYRDTRGDCCEIAIVNGASKSTAALLESILGEYGYEHKFDSVNELLSMLKVFMQQQTAAGRPPMLIIENTHEMSPAALAVLCDLATVRVREHFALKIVLVGDRPIEYIARAPAMEYIARRLTGDCHLQPLTMDETCDYLYAKVRRGGCMEPQFIFPEDICDELYRASGGWPGIVDRLALLAIASADKCPVDARYIEKVVIPDSTQALGCVNDADEAREQPGEPLLYLTHHGRTLRRVRFSGTRLLVGRSDLNDIAIESRFISRHHALLVRHGDTSLLMDLNSANGTYVNSRRVSNQVLANGDIVTLGEHALKYVDASARARLPIEGMNFDDTVVLKTVEDMRSILARENTAILSAARRKASGDTD